MKIPRGVYGPRGMMGDFIVLKDGTLLMSFTPRWRHLGIKSPDQGKTWGEPFQLVAKPQPPAKGPILPAQLPPACQRRHSAVLHLQTYPTTPYYGHNYYRRSADEGKTWTEQF